MAVMEKELAAAQSALFSITVFCELPSAHPARFYLFSPIYSLMIGRLMTFLGRGLLATIVPPNKPKCVLGIIVLLSRPSGVERPPEWKGEWQGWQGAKARGLASAAEIGIELHWAAA